MIRPAIISLQTEAIGPTWNGSADPVSLDLHESRSCNRNLSSYLERQTTASVIHVKIRR